MNVKAPAFTISELKGREAERYVDGLAQLRIRVFREFPYLYEGSLDYERKYLRTYFQSDRSFVALCFSAGTLVGASTAIHLSDAETEFQTPFLKRDIPLQEVCYYGESILLPELRGFGIGKAFMNSREKFARTLPGVKRLAFCSVVRDQASDLEHFWRKTGFEKAVGMTTEFSWKEIGESSESPKKMQFWLKNLERKS